MTDAEQREERRDSDWQEEGDRKAQGGNQSGRAVRGRRHRVTGKRGSRAVEAEKEEEGT